MTANATTSPAKLSWGKWLFYRLIGKSTKPTTDPHDPIREGLETIVFVVVLVFLLKQFVVEAYVIPTGSMAETLYGDHKNLTCPECGFEFTINSHAEIESQDGSPLRALAGYCCPNCRNRQVLTPVSKIPYTKSWSDPIFGPGNSSGDRVLVLKAIYHREKAKPGDVVVFKFPEEPQNKYSAVNYIKRMWATGGQTLAIWCGDLYVCDSLAYADQERPKTENDLWKIDYTYHNDTAAQKLFEESRKAGFPENGNGFKLLRKDDVILNEMMRIVYDNDHQAATLTTKGVPPRWKPDAADWTADAENKTFTHTGNFGWLRYRNLIVEDWRALSPGGRPIVPPKLIENFLGYNAESAVDNNGEYRFLLDGITEDSRYWVGDLVMECVANVTDPAAEITLELSKGPNRYQAIFKEGHATIRRTGPEGRDMASGPVVLGTGKSTLRFANVDSRLRLWVNGNVVPMDGTLDYAPKLPEHGDYDKDDVKREGWVRANDLDAPVSIGASGGVSVSGLKIWRDTYYIHFNNPYRTIQNVTDMVDTYYAQPGHYLCLGDNSAQSSDSRKWGSVPDRLLLGKACAIFFPIDRIGVIK